MDGADTGRTSGAEVAFWCACAAALLAANLLSIGGPRLYNDSCHYLNVAENVLSGRGFETGIIHYDIQYAAGGMPTPMTVYPIGYPALIAASTFAGVTAETGGLLISSASFVLLFPLLLWTGRLFRLPRGAIRWALVLLLLNGSGWIYATSVQTESPFTALALLTLALVSRHEASPAPSERSPWLLLGASVCAGMSVWIRYPGIFLVASLALWYGLRFLRRPSVARLGEALLAGVSVLAAGACLARNQILVGNIRGGNTKIVAVGIGRALRDLLASSLHLALGLETELSAFLRPGILEALFLAGALLAAAWVAGAMRRVGEARWGSVRTPAFRFAALWIVTYVAGMTYVMTHSPLAFNERYLYPLLPPAVLVFCALSSPLAGLARRGSRRDWALAAAVILLTLGYSGINARAVIREGPGPVREILRALQEEAVPDGGTVRSWIDRNYPKDGVVIASEGPATAHALNRKTFSLGGRLYCNQDWSEGTLAALHADFGARLLVLYPNAPGTREIASDFPFIAGLLEGRLPPWIALAQRSRSVLVFWLRDDVEPPG